METFLFLSLDKFFKKYCPGVGSYRYKIAGKNTRGNPVQFSKQDVQQIRDGMRQYQRDLFTELNQHSE